MLVDRIKELEDKVAFIEKNLSYLPKRLPLTKEFAIECGYKTIDGLRAWCFRNLSPDEFTQKGKFWFINREALAKIKRKVI